MALLLAIGVAILCFYIAPWFLRQHRMSRIRKIVIRKRLLVLTYDDGPSKDLTPQLLDLLRSRSARATFFMLGKHARLHPHIVDRVLKEGHTVGSHSDQHVHAWKASPNATVADIDAGYKSLSRWIPLNAMFRPPYGKMTAATYWWTHRRDIPVFWWTIDSGDKRSILPQAKRVADTVRREGGGIVLMHDINPTELRDNFVLQVTSALLDVAESESLHIVPLTEIYR
jgi:peptidoglycan/xylan/chitin deacetylase (PgdA/CDA1 family)